MHELYKEILFGKGGFDKSAGCFIDKKEKLVYRVYVINFLI